MTNLDNMLESRDIILPTKACIVKAVVFPVVMYGCESWTIKKVNAEDWCFPIVAVERILDSPLDCKGFRAVHPKGNQSWIFIGRTDAEAEAPILWPLHANNWLIGKDPDVGLPGWLRGKEFAWNIGDAGLTPGSGRSSGEGNGNPLQYSLPGKSHGQRSLVGYSPWGHKHVGQSWVAKQQTTAFAGKDWGQEEKGVKEDEMVQWHHWLNGLKFKQTLGDSEWQGSWVSYNLWGLKELDMT